jgi:putative protein kinase ArgK-like GTPase of G3E family
MAIMPLVDTPQGRRRARVAQRLRDALAVIKADPDAAVTVVALTGMAGVGRNALYANHRPILDGLRVLQAARRPASQCSETLDKGAVLEARLRLLATQNAGLLQRALVAEQRIARLEARNAELVCTLDAIRKPVPIRKPDGTADDEG